MNEEIRELLSAYVDGALSEPARRELEARLEASADLRRELAELRAVAESVRALPKETAPGGFAARVLSRRARGESPRRDWVLLPPSLRPVAFAMSAGVVALWIWQDVVVRPDVPEAPRPSARLVAAADAPLAQVNVSGPAAGKDADAGTLAAEQALGLKPHDGRAPSLARARAKGRALDEPADAANAPAAAAPEFAAEEGAPAAGAAGAMTEQARSARNVEMIADLERQKKEMGIVGIASGGAASSIAALRGSIAPEPAPAPVLSGHAPAMMAAKRSVKTRKADIADDKAAASDEISAAAQQAAPASPAASPAPAPPPPAGRAAPDAGLVFTDARSLASSWVLLGLPKNPPAVNFDASRAVLLKPSISKIVSVAAGPDAVYVVYRTLGPDEPSDPAQDRFALLPASPEAVRIIDATPR